VASPRACLIDVYDTILTSDFAAHEQAMTASAGLGPDAWNNGFALVEEALNEGRLSLAQGIEQILIGGGRPVSPQLVSDLSAQARDLHLSLSRLHDDAIPFLKLLRSRGIATAFVSNCGEDTRRLLEQLGVLDLVDVPVLSCEVGVAKPAPGIYQHALAKLGVPADAALFVDDQPGYCAGATALGITAIQIARGPAPALPAPGSTVVRSLLDIEPLLS
jgi:HAD superfamily hydrolase (TIGR01509 family)